MSKAPNWLTVPLDTSSPGPLSTGRDSPVITAWLTEVWPERMTPSTGTVSPGSTRSRSPTRTCLRRDDLLPVRRSDSRAVRGVRWTSFSMPARALATVSSSSRAPSCMMKATSPAAKSSPMTHRGDQGDGDQHVRLDVKGGDQADDGLQDDGHAAQDDGHPGRVEGQRAASQTGWPAAPRRRGPGRPRPFCMPPHSRRCFQSFHPWIFHRLCLIYP